MARTRRDTSARDLIMDREIDFGFDIDRATHVERREAAVEWTERFVVHGDSPQLAAAWITSQFNVADDYLLVCRRVEAAMEAGR